MANALYVFCGCGQGRVDVAFPAECARMSARMWFCAVEAGVGEGGWGWSARQRRLFECSADVHVLADEAQACPRC